MQFFCQNWSQTEGFRFAKETSSLTENLSVAP